MAEYFYETKYGDLSGQTYHDDIDLREYPELKYLDGAPSIVLGHFVLTESLLTSTLHIPSVITGDLILSRNKQMSLDVLPSVIGGELNLNYCNLIN